MIQVNVSFAINGEERNYIVVRKSKHQTTGEATYKSIAYFQDITSCVEYIYKIETRKWIQEHDADLHTALVAFGEIKQEIIAAVEGVAKCDTSPNKNTVAKNVKNAASVHRSL